MPESQQSEAYDTTTPAIYAQEEGDTDVFKACGASHSFCTVGLGECTLREGHKNWGQDHSCNKCGGTW